MDELVQDKEASNKAEWSTSGLSRPGTSKRVYLATQTLRVNTPKVVLGSSQALFLPEDHPLLNTINRVFGSFGVQGRITASSNGLTL